MSKKYFATLGSLVTLPAMATNLNIEIEIPQLNVGQYHRPYVAVWLEKEDNSAITTLSVWYQNPKNSKGEKWLKDMRSWWRKLGRNLDFPVDGVSQPTKPAGNHSLNFQEGKGSMPKLSAGKYKLKVEASRELGGLELITIPFEIPINEKNEKQNLSEQGKTELGKISLEIQP